MPYIENGVPAASPWMVGDIAGPGDGCYGPVGPPLPVRSRQIDP